MVAQHGSALSPWQKSCVWSEYPTQPPATSSTSPTDSGSRIVLPHLSLKIPATTAYPAASVGHVRQRLRTPRTRTKSNKPVAKGESRAPTRPHPPHRSPHLSLSALAVTVARARPSRRCPVGSRRAAQLRRELNDATARASPSSAPLGAALRGAAGLLRGHGVSSCSLRAIALR